VELGQLLLFEAWEALVVTTVGDLALFGGGENMTGDASARVDLFYPSVPLVTTITEDITATFSNTSLQANLTLSSGNHNIPLSLIIILTLFSSRPRCPDIKPSPQPLFWFVLLFPSFSLFQVLNPLLVTNQNNGTTYTYHRQSLEESFSFSPLTAVINWSIQSNASSLFGLNLSYVQS